MLFRCEDLERYVMETSREKMNLILINKADFLSEKQRQRWAEYFDGIKLRVAFFSALEENQNNLLRSMKIEEESEEVDEINEDDDEYEDVDESDEHEEENTVVTSEAVPENKETDKVSEPQDRNKSTECGALKEESTKSSADDQIKNSTRLLTRGELIELFKTIHKGAKVQEGRSVVGLVGYPNVGKSSTINSLLTFKKVSVSATPGKTKHFQVRPPFLIEQRFGTSS